jgi:hypothetical protein
LKNRLIALLALLAAAGLLVAGCGDDDESTTGSGGAALSKAEYVKQANAICAAGSKEIAAEFEAFAKEHGIDEKNPPSKDQIAEAAEEFLIPSIAAQVEEIGELSPPEGEEEPYETFVENAEAALEEGEDDPATFAEDDGGPFAEVNEEAIALDLQACGE